VVFLALGLVVSISAADLLQRLVFGMIVYREKMCKSMHFLAKVLIIVESQGPAC